MPALNALWEQVGNLARKAARRPFGSRADRPNRAARRGRGLAQRNRQGPYKSHFKEQFAAILVLPACNTEPMQPHLDEIRKGQT